MGRQRKVIVVFCFQQENRNTKTENIIKKRICKLIGIYQSSVD